MTAKEVSQVQTDGRESRLTRLRTAGVVRHTAVKRVGETLFQFDFDLVILVVVDQGDYMFRLLDAIND